MSKVATNFVNQYNLTPQMSIAELSNYAEELVKHLKDAKARDHARNRIQKLGFKAIYDPDITRRSNKEQAINQELREDEEYDCPEFFYLENVQKRLKDCNITNSPTMQNLMDIMIMLSIRSADVANLCVDYYKPSNTDWYDPKYSWYCTGYAKNKKDEPRPLVSMEKDPLLARELLIWIQKAIPNEFPFLIRDKDGDVNVHPINNFLAIYGISSSYLRKIGSDHAIIIHEGKTRSKCNRLCKLALRYKINREASDHYSVMNNRLNTPAPKQENSEVEDIIDLYGEISDDDN
ncbi:17933_t:CDS:2 [Dentiscutata erythropus]|uniref:17933_t:CDS:1 n=1 Tax=Dentiscutata erythropus TaxID=1348616 RepID=A0A9N8ZG13_9GLOM|nr:17933_t:CDS:2 [Dentiscutata erythropus]